MLYRHIICGAAPTTPSIPKTPATNPSGYNTPNGQKTPGTNPSGYNTPNGQKTPGTNSNTYGSNTGEKPIFLQPEVCPSEISSIATCRFPDTCYAQLYE